MDGFGSAVAETEHFSEHVAFRRDIVGGSEIPVAQTGPDLEGQLQQLFCFGRRERFRPQVKNIKDQCVC